MRVQECIDYVDNKWKEWNEVYEIPFGYEFQLKAMFELEYQYKTTPINHVKTKREIIEMIQRISERCRLKPKEKINKIIIDGTGMIIIDGKIIYKCCDNCIFLSSKTTENEWACCRPKHPKFYDECNLDNNWKYYISNEIYKNNIPAFNENIKGNIFK